MTEEKLAYLRDGKQDLEVDFPLESIWDAIPKAVAKLDWKIQEKDETTHHLTIRTNGSFLSYGSTLKIKLAKENEKTTYVAIDAETPVTTITSVFDYGQAYERINLFVITLAQIMNS
ncbi:MAG: hypothetical protein ACLQO7_03545 [Candidatus Bathyarchaeia archaeon]